jgi:circadian clock protein KaiC
MPEHLKTGVSGLDEVLHGGLAPGRMYLIEGLPGSGKTTLGLQFLIEGVRHGERVLYISLSEAEEELRAAAASHGWSLDGVLFRVFIPTEDSLRPSQQYTVFHPSEVELGETIAAILADAEKSRPTRVVFDSLSGLRLLAGSTFRYRLQVLALKQFFSRLGCTVLLIDDLSGGEEDRQLRSVASGIIVLEQLHPAYGSERRRLCVVKHRGATYRGGFHDFAIREEGLVVFPRPVALLDRKASQRDTLGSGIDGLDTLLGGGIQRGTATLVAGPPGTGKSSLAIQLVSAAAERGQSAAVFLFDESPTTLLMRARGLGVALEDKVAAGRVRLRQVDPAELAPGEFASDVLAEVRSGDASIVVIDSLNGYLHAMPEEKFLIVQLHELLTCLGQLGVATVLVSVQHGLVGPANSPIDASYLADTVVQLRYFELDGEVRQAISVTKKRGGLHERTIREFFLEPGGIRVGEPLRRFRGVLTGIPERLDEPDGRQSSPDP